MARSTEMFFSPWQAADYAGLKIEAIYELLEAGEIPADQVDGRWRIRKTSMDAWLDAEVPPEEIEKLATQLRHLTAAQARNLLDEVQDEAQNG
jgi:excisionase family DNA binding protein